MAEFIYSRVSTTKQETANQLHSMLAKYPTASVVEETASGGKARPELDALIDRLNSGDTLVVYALDRLGRRCGELVQLLDQLNREGIILISLREGIDLSTMGGRFVAQIFAALAELERGLIRERIKTALAAKKAAGVKLGKPSKLTAEQIATARELKAAGGTTREIGKALGVSHTTAYRALKREETA